MVLWGLRQNPVVLKALYKLALGYYILLSTAMTQVFPGTLNVGMGYLHMDKELRDKIQCTVQWFHLEQRVGFTSTLKAAVKD